MDSLEKVAPMLGKAFIAIMAVFFGFGHLANAGAMAGIVPVPGGVFWVYLTGVCLIAGGVGLFIPKLSKLAGLLLGLLILVFALTIHLPGMLGEGGQSSMMAFFKDLAIAGGAWLAGLTKKA